MTAAASAAPGGALVNVISVGAEHLEDFEDWYSFEHFPERLAVPGFRRARRYVELDPAPEERPVEFFSIYETDDVATLTSAAYLAALDTPTDWTRRVAPTFAGNERSVGRLHAFDGVGRSARIAVVRFAPAAEAEPRIRDAVESAVRAALASRAIVHGFLVEGDGAATAAKDRTAEGRSMAGSSDASGSRWFVVVELHGIAPRVDAPALRAMLLPEAVEGAVSDVALREYRLIVDRGADVAGR